MKLSQLLKAHSLVGHWSFENYSEDGSFVYPDYGSTDSLLNFGAALGCAGESNANFSSKSCNLKGGYLTQPNGSFLSAQLASRVFAISFSFKTDGSKFLDSKALLSKWTPDQQIWIGLENGSLVVKSMLNGTLNTATFARDKVIWNPNFWNQVMVRVTTTDITVYVNGAGDASATVGGSFSTSTDSVWTIGDPVNMFTGDCFLSDLAFTTTDDGYLPVAAYRFTRSDKECWLGQAPSHYFDIGNHFAATGDCKVPNLGYAGGYGYIVNSTTSAVTSQNLTGWTINKNIVVFPQGSWFMIDGDLNWDLNYWYSMAYYGYRDSVGGPASGGNYGIWTTDLLMDLSASSTGGNTWRCRVGGFIQSSSTAYADWFYEVRNEAGTVLSYKNNASVNSATDFCYNTGLKAIRFKNNSISLRAETWDYNSISESQTTTSFSSTYQPTAPYTWNRFFYNTVTSNYYRVADFGLFEYSVSDNQINAIVANRVNLFSYVVSTLYSPSHYNTLMWSGSSSGGIYYHSPNSNPFYTTSGTSWVYGLNDSFGSRMNDIRGTYYLPSGAYATHYYYRSNEHRIYVETTNNFTLNFFIWNKNTTSRFEVFLVSDYNVYSSTVSTTGKLSLAINSYNSAFEYGSVEYTTNAWNSQYTVSSRGIVKDDGYHMITIIRNGTRMELWIDAKRVGAIVTPAITSIPGTAANDEYYYRMLRGGPCYISGLTSWLYNAMSQSTIEFLYQGHSPEISGKTVLDGSPIEAVVYAIDHDSGQSLANPVTSDETTGEFNLKIPKNLTAQSIDVVAVPIDAAKSNQVVVHGPYGNTTVPSRWTPVQYTRSYNNAVIDNSPLAYYQMDETSGTTIYDYSGNALHGTLVGTNRTLGQSAPASLKGILFGGTDSYITLPSGFANFTNGFTFEIWAAPTASGSNANFFDLGTLARAASAASVDTINGYRSGTTNNIVMYGRNNSGTADYITSTTGGIDNWYWKHYVFRIRPGGTYDIIVNGVYNFATATGKNMPTNVTRTLNWIGLLRWTGNAFYTGYLSSAAIYDYALSDEDIAAHCAQGFTMDVTTFRSTILATEDAAAYWTFDKLEDLVDSIHGLTLVKSQGAYLIRNNSLVLNASVQSNTAFQISTDNFYVDKSQLGRWSIELSFRSVASNAGALVSQWDGGTGTGMFKLGLTSNSTVVLYVNTSSSNIVSTGTYSNALWHHVVVTYDGFTAKLYLDNTLAGSLATTIASSSLNALTVGSTSTLSEFFSLRTELDDLVFYERTLTTGDIDRHYTLFNTKKLGVI